MADENRELLESVRLLKLRAAAMTEEYALEASQQNAASRQRALEAQIQTNALAQHHAKKTEEMQRALADAATDARATMKREAEDAFYAYQVEWNGTEESLRREIAELQRQRLRDAGRTSAADPQRPCTGCAQRDAEISKLTQELDKRNLEKDDVAAKGVTLYAAYQKIQDDHKDLCSKYAIQDTERGRMIQRTNTLQTALDQARMDFEREKDEQDVRHEAKLRTAAFAHDRKVEFANERIRTLEATIADLRAARTTGRTPAKQRSHASTEAEQYDIFGKDGEYDEDYYEDDQYNENWTEPVYASYRPHASGKLYAGTQTQTQTRTSASSSTQARDAHDDGGRPPRRPDGGGGGAGSGGGRRR
jgi:hypothetical protein